MDILMTSGDAAARIGVSVTALKVWELKGRIAPMRAVNGMRLYDEQTVNKLRDEYREAHDERKQPGMSEAR